MRFSERGVARDVLKVLNSAVANAEHTLHLPVDELYVSIAYADEGPTIKRWRPRARGRATRIRKRTSHITVVVAPRVEDEPVEKAPAKKSPAKKAAAKKAPAKKAAAKKSPRADAIGANPDRRYGSASSRSLAAKK